VVGWVGLPRIVNTRVAVVSTGSEMSLATVSEEPSPKSKASESLTVEVIATGPVESAVAALISRLPPAIRVPPA